MADDVRLPAAPGSREPSPAVSAVPASIPSADDRRVTYWPDVAVVQPLLEPDPKAVRKFGAFAVFAYWRWSCLAIGFDLMPGGLALHFGPLMFGAVKIQPFTRYAQAIEARSGETREAGLDPKDESAVAKPCAQGDPQ